MDERKYPSSNPNGITPRPLKAVWFSDYVGCYWPEHGWYVYIAGGWASASFALSAALEELWGVQA